MTGLSYYIILFFFFFQAEDGIRDYKVTGVQTCALPILQDVALLSVGVREQRDAAGPVRVVLDGRHAGRNAELVPPEVDPAVAALVPAAPPARRDVPLVVAPARLRERLHQPPPPPRPPYLGQVPDP